MEQELSVERARSTVKGHSQGLDRAREKVVEGPRKGKTGPSQAMQLGKGCRVKSRLFVGKWDNTISTGKKNPLNSHSILRSLEQDVQVS